MILIVEDSPTQAAELQFYLEHHGFTVLTASNGKTALALMQQQRPTLIITDVMMPEMNGYELCRAIKADPALQDIPVIVVTSLTGWDDITRSLECGADNFLRKPFEFDTLIARIEYMLLNLELRGERKVRAGLEIMLGGRRLRINLEREQILDLLVSTYDEVIHMNGTLQAQQREVAHANEILRGLYQISLQLAQAESAHAVCAKALQGMAGLPGISPSLILLRGSDGVPDVVTHSNQASPATCLTKHDCACRRVLEADAELISSQLVSCHCQPSIGSGPLIATPLYIAKRMVGVLATVPQQADNPDNLDILDAAGHQIAAALERVELLDSLNQRATRLEEANHELESFSSSVSHDLRAPLRAVDGFSGLLKRHLGSQLDAEGARLLAVISDNCGKMDRLINGLLEFSRLCRLRISEAAIDMTAMAKEIANELGADQAAHDLAIHVDELPHAPADPILIRQVWINLISNAIKYSSGRLARRVEISGQRDGPNNVYAVKDNGAGFDMQYYDRLFGMFQRLHSEQDYPGCGIGLANVKRIVTRHGGDVWADAAEGVGATFYFSLPATPH